jgi:TonB family protein
VSEALGEQGTTTVRFTVTEEGTATAATIETSSGSMRLDDASIEEIQTRWRYRPARTSDNKPVACVYKAEVRWILHDNAHVLPPELQRMVLRMAPADYPAGARARREQGVVFLLVQYDGSGKKVSVISSSGFAELDRAAERIITEKLVIAPGMFNGQAIMTTAFVPVQWILDDAAVAPKKSD